MRFVRQEWQSPVGRLFIVANQTSLVAIAMNENKQKIEKFFSPEPVLGSNSILSETIRQLEDYFQGRRKAFNLPVALFGTDFQMKAWNALKTIPYGSTRTYAEQAHSIFKPKAVRAIGAANGRNPISIVIPCHRVIGANGQLTGYAGGLAVKKYLLELEKSA